MSRDCKPLCPFCTSDASRVIESRGTVRRRQCVDCDSRFTTDETPRRIVELRTPMHRPKHHARQPSLL